MILLTNNINHFNRKWLTGSGVSTDDKIFLLSIQEAEDYFENNSDRMTTSTEYAKRQGKDQTASEVGELGCWWLRTSGLNGFLEIYASCVDSKGFVNENGKMIYNSGVAVRPALWLRL
jgi:hypothetical protein